MSHTGFYWDNEQRAYPLIRAEPVAPPVALSSFSEPMQIIPVTWYAGMIIPLQLHHDLPAVNVVTTDPGILPYSTIADFGALMNLDAKFIDGTDFIYLSRVIREQNDLVFFFRTTAVGGIPVPLIFRVPADAPEFTEQYETAGSDIDAGNSLSSTGFCTHEPVWEGFIVFGDLTAISNILAEDGDSFEFDIHAWLVEPARIQNLAASFVRSLNLANYSRTQVLPQVQCDTEAIGSVQSETVFVNAICLTGSLVFKEGYHASISQAQNTNTITIGAAVGAGAGVPCTETPLFPGETPPDQGTFLTGGPSCTEILKTINGVNARIFRLFGGAGVQVSPDPEDAHGIVVNIDLTGLAVCP